MHPKIILSALIVLVIAGSMSAGCSKSGSEPALPSDEVRITCPNGDLPENRYLWGIWDFRFDLTKPSVEIEPLRDIQAHYNVTQYLIPPACDDCINVNIDYFAPATRILSMTVHLRNPFKVHGYDVRGILYTDNDGHELRNPDNWTNLFDIQGGEDINPFKAYAKDNINRMFSCPEFEHYLIYIPNPPKYETIRYAADASYPENCKEPYEIVDFHQDDILSSAGSSGNVYIDVHDWQNDVNKVSMQTPGLTGDEWVDFTQLTGDTWGLLLTNTTGISAGYYPAIIKATSSGSSTLALYDKITITILSAPSDGWARTWGGVNTDRGYSVAVHKEGNVYTAGRFEWTVDFDPGPGVDLHSANDGELSGCPDAFLSKFDSAGNFQWAQNWGGPVGCNSAESYCVAVNDAGDIFVAGIFWGTVDFDPSEGVEWHTVIGEQDIFLSKFDASGNFQWVRVWGGEGTDEAWGIAVDKSGNPIITGRFGFTVDFDPGPGEDTHVGDACDNFLSNFNSSGDFLWARTWGGKNSDFDISYGIAVDGLENIYVTGTFGKKADFDPGASVDEHTSVGGGDIFVSKFNSSGEFQWARTWGGADDDYGKGIAADSSGNSYVTGWFRHLADFDPGPGVDEHSSDAEDELYLSKFDTSGNFIWARTWNGSAGEDGMGAAVDGAGNPYIIGWFNGTLDLDPGSGVDEYTTTSYGAFLCKFNTTGEFQWGREWGGYEGNDSSMPFGVAVDNAGYAFVTGDYEGSVDFDPSPGIDEHFGYSIIDVFLLKFNPDGEW